MRGSTPIHYSVRALPSLAGAPRGPAMLVAEGDALEDLPRVSPLANMSRHGGARRRGCTSPARGSSDKGSALPVTKHAMAHRAVGGLLQLSGTLLQRLLRSLAVASITAEEPTGR